LQGRFFIACSREITDGKYRQATEKKNGKKIAV
jgi:hypothetical protein